MTKDEFLFLTPSNIYHKMFGYGELELATNTLNVKSVCYRHIDQTIYCEFSAKTWAFVYQKLMKYLRREGFERNKFVDYVYVGNN